MKFKNDISPILQELLEMEYRDYIKRTPMTKAEQRAVREWVEEGRSVYENPEDAWQDGQTPVEFLTVYRDNEFIRRNTKGMTEKEAHAFAMAYFGWSVDEQIGTPITDLPEAYEEDIFT